MNSRSMSHWDPRFQTLRENPVVGYSVESVICINDFEILTLFSLHPMYTVS